MAYLGVLGDRSFEPFEARLDRFQREASLAIRKTFVRRPRGVATLDYVLLMGIVLPLAGFVLWAAPRMMNRVYEFTTALTGLPF
ncbi:MAG: hypothetical protein ACKO38_16755 [Planctomycetota bacterium]